MNRFTSFRTISCLLIALCAASVSEAANVAPVISGTPVTSVAAGSLYSFKPVATDANRDRIRFAISGLPSWGTFNRYSGELRGMPPLGMNAAFSNIVISASDRRLSSSLPPFSIKVSSAVANSPPVISGNPSATVAASSPYDFKPVATDANGDSLSFSIQGKPSWAIFSIATGQLSGTAPAAATVNPGIVISVSDGSLSAALPAFAIAVQSSSTLGTAALSWTAPTQNTDGSALSDLAGFRLYYGATSSALTQMLQIAGAGTTSHVLSNLSAGTWYFALSAYSIAGAESAMSNIGSKTIP
jgi:hypothetical protein